MAAVFLGFGTFLVNSAFSFSQFQNHEAMGWSAKRQGYLSESQLLNALAIFTVLLGTDASAISREIKSHYRSLYKRACKTASGTHARLELLRSIEPLSAESRDIADPCFAGGETRRRLSHPRQSEGELPLPQLDGDPLELRHFLHRITAAFAPHTTVLDATERHVRLIGDRGVVDVDHSRLQP